MKYQYRVLPCPNFARHDMDIIRQYGFLTYPYFLDNGFKTKQGIKWKQAVTKAKALKPLQAQAKEIEGRIIKYLKDTNQDGVRCGELIIVRNAQERKIRKKKDESEHDGMQVLRGYGIGRNRQEAKQSLDEILAATRGKKTSVEKLVIDRIK